jgi:hypothetical protein
VLRPSDAAAQTTFKVDMLSDAIDVSPGDGACATAGGQCTLRAAVIAANSLPGGDTITFGVAGTFALGLHGSGDDASLNGDLDMTDDLTLTGSGKSKTVVDGDGTERVFHLDPLGSGPTLRMTGLTTSGGTVAGQGGEILNTGKADLDLRKVVVTGELGQSRRRISNASNYAEVTLGDVVVDSNRPTNHVGGRRTREPRT